jgi:hypothetical protein
MPLVAHWENPQGVADRALTDAEFSAAKAQAPGLDS